MLRKKKEKKQGSMCQTGLLFPKNRKENRARMRHPDSILHPREMRTCYLCMVLEDNWNEYTYLERHHIFGGPNKQHSEEYGLTVYLCLRHHTGENEAAHLNAGNMQILHDAGREAFKKEYPDLDFLAIFGKNYVRSEKSAERGRI